MKFLLTLLLSVFAAAAFCRNSQAIIIPDRPNSIEKTAAAELQYHLEKSTGVKIPVLPEKKWSADIKGGFFLGATRAAAERKLDVSGEPLNSFLIRRDGDFLFIVGRDNTCDEKALNAAPGTLFGVYHYLRQLMGVRWLWPGLSGESIPKHSAIVINDSLNGLHRPAFQFVRATTLKTDDEIRWGRRVMNTSEADFLPGPSPYSKWAFQYAKEHPEWFALRADGKRDLRKHAPLCISNPQFQDQIVNKWWSVQKKYPDSDLMINVKENDTQDRCTCPECLALDGLDKRGPTGRYELYRNVGDRYAKFYRQVYDKAVKFKPDAGISVYAYQSYFYAPRQVKLNQNFYVGLVPDIPFPRLPAYNKWLRDEYRAWRDSGATLYLRPNYFYGGYCMPEVWYDQYADELNFLRKLGCIGVMIDGPSLMWATRGLDTYVMGRLCATPDAKPESLVSEYCEAFGPAAREIGDYFEHWRKYLLEHTEAINKIYESSSRKWYFHGFHYAAYAHRIFPADELKKGRPFLERAAVLTEAGTPERTKVDFLRQGLEYAIASSECAALFADRQTSVEQKRTAWNNLRKLRAALPPQAVDPAYLDKIEKNVWKLPAPAAVPAGDTQALAEKWQVCPDPSDEGENKQYQGRDFDSSRWDTASTWLNLEPQGFVNYRNMWYRTTCHIAEKSSDKVILYLGAVDENCKVWVNGQFCGELQFDALKDPDSWKKPFEVDISDHVRFNGDNVIAVKLTNKAGFGGVWKPCYLIFR